MIGAVIITHGPLAASLLETAELIVGRVEKVRALAVGKEETSEEIKALLTAAVAEVGEEGAVIFTDMFGGTPTNIALSLLEKDRVEVLTGVNLPMLVKFESYRRNKPLGELVTMLVEQGRESMVLASAMLKAKQE
ncbi:MAG TPA: PTS sugar transporter [Deltaproteobacteria bacterium]|nr:PTS sugar transporter [Deltaproteobacteria bacterium]